MGDGQNMENMTMSEKIAFEKQKEEKAEWAKKMIVDNAHFSVNTHGVGTYQLDKYKGLLNDPENIKKKGLILGKKYLKDSTLDMGASIVPFPISLNAYEDKSDGITRPQGNARKFNP